MHISGDFDLMQPYFKMYDDALDMAKERTKKYYGHPDAQFPEEEKEEEKGTLLILWRLPRPAGTAEGEFEAQPLGGRAYPGCRA